jgi:hypothetical protein
MAFNDLTEQEKALYNKALYWYIKDPGGMESLEFFGNYSNKLKEILNKTKIETNES